MILNWVRAWLFDKLYVFRNKREFLSIELIRFTKEGSSLNYLCTLRKPEYKINLKSLICKFSESPNVRFNNPV